MNRIDFLGVPGVGKTTTYKLLRQIRQNPNEFLLFTEAYNLALKSQLPPLMRFANSFDHLLGSKKYLHPFCEPLGRMVNHEFAKVIHKFESEMLLEQITGMWRKYPDMLFLRLNSAGKHFIIEQKIEPSEYLIVLLKIALSMKQFNLINHSLPEKTTVVIEKSFTQMVFFNIDFSRKVDPEIVFRYIKGTPLPAGVINFNTTPEVIVKRLRQRAKEGRIAKFHSSILETDLLEEWVNKACEIVQHARCCLLEQGVNVFDLNTEEEPYIVANNAREFILRQHK